MGGSQTFKFADRTTVAKTAVGFAVALAFLGLLATWLGTRRVTVVLSNIDPLWLGVGCLSTLLCLAAWGKGWQVVLREVGVEASYRRLLVTYFAATFANYVTPLGQAGGEPFIAYVLARDTEASYEDSLASVVTADLLNLLPFFSFSAVGLGILLWRTELPELVRPLAQGLLALAVGVPALVVLGWRFRQRLRRAVLIAVTPVARHTRYISLTGVRERIDDLYTAFGRIARNPWRLLEAVAFAYIGWVFFALPLFFAGRALGYPLGILLVLFAVPASTLAGLIPSPGGLGGVEAALTLLLVTLVPAVGPGTAFAIAIVYRVASYWFALGIGGVAVLYILGRT